MLEFTTAVVKYVIDEVLKVFPLTSISIGSVDFGSYSINAPKLSRPVSAKLQNENLSASTTGVAFCQPEPLRMNARHMFSIPLSYIEFRERLRLRSSSFLIISRSIILPISAFSLLADRSRALTLGHPRKDSTNMSTCEFCRFQSDKVRHSSCLRRGNTSAIGLNASMGRFLASKIFAPGLSKNSTTELSGMGAADRYALYPIWFDSTYLHVSPKSSRYSSMPRLMPLGITKVCNFPHIPKVGCILGSMRKPLAVRH